MLDDAVFRRRHQNLDARLGEAFGDTETDTAGGAGDDGGTAFEAEQGHGGLPYRYFFGFGSEWNFCVEEKKFKIFKSSVYNRQRFNY